MKFLKNIEAILRGYACFRVNGKRFWLYSNAKAYRLTIPDEMSVYFDGWHIFRGWEGFFSRHIIKAIKQIDAIDYEADAEL